MGGGQDAAQLPTTPGTPPQNDLALCPQCWGQTLELLWGEEWGGGGQTPETPWGVCGGIDSGAAIGVCNGGTDFGAALGGLGRETLELLGGMQRRDRIWTCCGGGAVGGQTLEPPWGGAVGVRLWSRRGGVCGGGTDSGAAVGGMQWGETLEPLRGVGDDRGRVGRGCQYALGIKTFQDGNISHCTTLSTCALSPAVRRSKEPQHVHVPGAGLMPESHISNLLTLPGGNGPWTHCIAGETEAQRSGPVQGSSAAGVSETLPAP